MFAVEDAGTKPCFARFVADAARDCVGSHRTSGLGRYRIQPLRSISIENRDRDGRLAAEVNVDIFGTVLRNATTAFPYKSLQFIMRHCNIKSTLLYHFGARKHWFSL